MTIPVVASLVGMVIVSRTWPTLASAEIIVWIALVVVTDLLPVPLWRDVMLALSLPILLAAAIVYPPQVAAIIAWVGSVDPRELRHRVPVPHALYNRSQVALSTLAASSVFHLLRGDLHTWPHVVFVALAALLTDVLVNVPLVHVAARLLHKHSLRSLVQNMSSGDPVAFFSAYLSFGLVAVLLALAFDFGGNWGLATVAIPILLARQVFVQSRRLAETQTREAEKGRMLLSVSESVAAERREERLSIAAGLHDEILPPLYKVHLLGQVVRQDLVSGRLLALEDDVPDLVSATQDASDATRLLIRQLRRSPLGPGGLGTTLVLLVRALAEETTTHIHTEIGETGGSPVVQLLAYQVAREAIHNAIRHSGARNIWLRVSRDGGDMRLVVEDDGLGFEPGRVDSTQHFGLQLMRERVELAGGVFQLDTRVRAGTRVIARLPAETSG